MTDHRNKRQFDFDDVMILPAYISFAFIVGWTIRNFLNWAFFQSEVELLYSYYFLALPSAFIFLVGFMFSIVTLLLGSNVAFRIWKKTSLVSLLSGFLFYFAPPI